MARMIGGAVVLAIDIYDFIATYVGWFDWSITHQLPQPSVEDIIPQFLVWVWSVVALGCAALIIWGYRAWKQG